MKTLFTHQLLTELIEKGYLYVAYFDGADRTILYPFKLPIAEEKLAILNFHQLPIEDLVVNYMAEEAEEKQIYISKKYLQGNLNTCRRYEINFTGKFSA